MNKILIAVPTGESIRRAEWLNYYHQLLRSGENISEIVHMFTHGSSPAKGRNIMIETALAQSCTHILFLDDDMAAPPDILTRLLIHDKDVVSALYCMRNYPHFPVAFDEVYEDGKNRFYFLEDGITGLKEVTNCGLGAVLINTKIFEKLERPYIRLGELEKDGWCDDIGFFNRVRKAGFKIYLDLDVRVGHMANMTIFPHYIDGKWVINYHVGENGIISIPMINPRI